MTHRLQSPDAKPITSQAMDPAFAAEVVRRSGTNLNLCWHCRTCASGCPFSQAMDLFPNEVIRLVQLGQKREALECGGIWICVGCNTCSIQCPNAIDIPAVNDALRHMALEEGRTVAEPDILKFHREVVDSIKRYGRTHKLEIMVRFKLKKRDWLNDLSIGWKLLSRGKLEFLPSKIKDLKAVRRILLRRRRR
jgi:heterodisulfide reductase subunit C